MGNVCTFSNKSVEIKQSTSSNDLISKPPVDDIVKDNVKVTFKDTVENIVETPVDEKMDNTDPENNIPSTESDSNNPVQNDGCIQLSKDSIVNSIVKKFVQRSNFGLKKYGKTLDRKDLTIKDWVQHMEEELMDAILYLEKLRTELQILSSSTELLCINRDITVEESDVETPLEKQLDEPNLIDMDIAPPKIVYTENTNKWEQSI